MTERIFTGVTLPRGAGTGVTGVRVLDRFSRRFRRLPDPAERTTYALVQAADRLTLGVTIHDDTPAQHNGLDLMFALHLSNYRPLRLGLERRAVVCSATAPTVAGTGAVRLPHLLATRPHMRAPLVDAVVWEVMSEQQAVDWLGGRELPDQAWFESQLPGLMRLRVAHRAGLLDGSELASRLADGFYLSIRAAYLNEELIRGHLLELDDAAGADGRDGGAPA